MAKSSESSTKEPGRFRQIVDVFKMTAKYDKPGVAMMIIGAVLPIVAAFLVCFFMYRTNVIMWIILMLLGVLVGLLLFMFVLNNRAEKVAYSQLEGRQGATGSVLQ
jgi:ABC-type multidrug transport system permease subunit